jgi:hypothetical protein
MLKGVICAMALAMTLVLLYKTFQRTEVKEDPAPRTPASPEIGQYLYAHRTYGELYSIMKDWERSAPDLVETGTYGSTPGGKDLHYLKISNELAPGDKTVMVTACIHGNEPLSTSTVMAYAGKLLSAYGKDEAITKLVNSRTIYFVPVVSPDSYPDNRRIEGKDPNRDFPTLKNPNKISVAPVESLKKLFLKISPDSVLAGHTFGRVYLIPWGDSTKDNPNVADYERIASQMCALSRYKFQRACEMYDRPIYGTEIDWYHRNGAFAMVSEFGTHQREATEQETIRELERTFEAFLYFLEESVKVDIKQSPVSLKKS